MNLHLRYIQGLQSVVQSVGVVGPGTGVYDEAVGAHRFANEADHLALVLRLPELQVQALKLFLDEPLYVVEGHGSVDFGTPGAEGAKVHAVEDEDLTQRPPRSPRGPLLRSRARYLRVFRYLRGARTCAVAGRLWTGVSYRGPSPGVPDRCRRRARGGASLRPRSDPGGYPSGLGRSARGRGWRRRPFRQRLPYRGTGCILLRPRGRGLSYGRSSGLRAGRFPARLRRPPSL